MLGALPTRTSAPSVHLTYPPLSLFTFPPASLPEVLPPPVSVHTLARPFSISPKTYNNVLSVDYPITIALIYAISVAIVNKINKQRGNKPWAFSKSYAFFAFVILHNVFLAVYSAWTFFGMLNALRAAWPGWEGKNALAGAMDALCKIHGPRGLGNAATYNSTNSLWGVTNKAMKLTTGGTPDTTDVGRIWNEGLGYYGWLFYLSKFYEVMDTAIILAKGKKSSLLQTFHHVGAMMCMWAGIRYMAPPIWMFVLVNSGVHALMYTYYALCALGIRVPQAVKRTLTTLQISQFVVGAFFAVAHLFIAYDIPVSVPYLFVHNLSSAIPQVTSSVSSALASITATAGVGEWLKKMALRAAGEEGLAENVRNNQGETFGIDAVHAKEAEKVREEIRYRNEYQTVRCVDTSGQAFAILLNVFYLAPLTWLFVNFFIRSYLRRTSSSAKHPTHEHTAEKARRDASKGIEREIREAMSEDQSRGDVDMPANLSADLKAKLNDLKSNAKQAREKLSQKAEKGVGKVQEGVDKGKANAKNAMDHAQKKVDEGKGDAKDAVDKAQHRMEQGKENLKDSVGKAQKKVEQGKADAKNGLEKAQKTMEQGNANAKVGGERAQEKVEQGKAAAKDGLDKAQEKAEQGKAAAKDGLDRGQEKAEQGKAAAKDGVKKTQEKAEQGKANAKDGLEKGQKKADQAKADTKDAAEKTYDDSSDGELVPKDVKGDATAYEANPDEVKNDAEKEAERQMQPQPNGKGDDDAAAAYEANIDEVTDKNEKEAEKKMQPKGSSVSAE